MNTYLLTWNPRRWTWDDFSDYVTRSAEGERPTIDWSTGNNRSIAPGDRVFLLRQAIDRGIIASGYAVSWVVTGTHWDGSGATVNKASFEIDTVLPVEGVLPVEKLKAARLGVNWDRVQASGVGVPVQSVRRLEELWHRHLVRHRRQPSAPFPDEVPSPARYAEGAVRRVFVNAYERNPAARRACIAHYGTDCVVCGFNFVQVYGPMGEGFIHVHHVRDLATIGEEYEVDPVADLRPVCPNCHAMLHTRTPAMRVEELRRIVEANRSKARQELHRL